MQESTASGSVLIGMAAGGPSFASVITTCHAWKWNIQQLITALRRKGEATVEQQCKVPSGHEVLIMRISDYSTLIKDDRTS